jgi:hypothetical protein
MYLLGNGSLYAGLLHLHLELVEEDPEELLHVVLHEAVQRLPTKTLPSQQRTPVERREHFYMFLIRPLGIAGYGFDQASGSGSRRAKVNIYNFHVLNVLFSDV